MNQYQTSAHRLNRLGFNVTAIREGAKAPAHKWECWQDTRQTVDDVNGFPWLGAGGIGAIMGIGGLHVFDFDKCPDYGPVATVLQGLGLADSYPWLWRSGSGNGYGVAVLCFEDLPSGVLSTNGKGPGVFSAPGIGFDHLELRWQECQTLLPPSKHPSGPGYAWLNKQPDEPPATVAVSQILAAFSAVTVRPEPRPKPANTPAPVLQPTGNGYGAAALRNEIDALVRARDGDRNNQLNRSSFALGQLVAGGELERAKVETALLAAALRIGLDERQAAATLRSGLDAGALEPRTAPEPEHRPATVANFTATAEPPAWLEDAPVTPYILDGDGAPAPSATTKPTKTARQKPARLATLSIRDLLTRQWPEPVWAVPGLLPVGLTILAGRPKIGKSWLCLQLVQAVTTGGVFLGQRVARGSCLYLALEDPPRRLAERAKLQGWEDLDAQADFATVGSFQRGDGRGLAAIIAERGYRLVIVDTLSRAFSGDKNDGGDMTAQLTPVQEAAHAAGCAVVVIHHHNKLGAATTGAADGVEPDPLVNLQGSVSIGGMADCIVGMYRQADKRGVLLTGYGRDVEEYALNLTFDRTTHAWQAVDVGAPKVTDERAAVLATIAERGPSTLMELVKELKADKGNLYRRLQNMVSGGMLDVDAKGCYGVPEA